MFISLESLVEILLITAIGAVNVPDTFTPSLICIAVESVLEMVFTFMSVLPVMVRMSPDIATVMLLPPATFIVSPSLISVPVLSSPTNVIPCGVADCTHDLVPSVWLART